MAYDVVIAGGGPAGVTSAIYTARAGLKIKVLDPMGGGGQAGTTNMIYNYPGFPQGISGPRLMESMIEQARAFGADIEFGEILSVRKDNHLFAIKSDDGDIQAKSVIWAAGTTPKTLGVPGEDKFTGRGVSFCATCDGALFRDKVVAVVGGGDSALTEAEFLTKFAREVILIHRRDEFRAGLASVKRVTENPRIKIRLESVVEQMIGNGTLEAIVVHDVKAGKTEQVGVDGVFLYVGSIPNSSAVKELADLTGSGYIITGDDMSTVTPGLFAVGDVREKPLRQVATAVGDGAVAAWALEKYLLEEMN
jgi:thioredoxin reductase (NADPH)